MLRIVVDTNVLVSGIIAPDSPPARLLYYWQQHRIALVSCQRAVDGLMQVLQRPKLVSKYPLVEQKRKEILALIQEQLVFVSGNTITGVVTRDVKDDMFIACAVEGDVRYLVSGDKDLLSLKQYQAVKIISPGYFMRLVERCQRLFPPD